MSYRIVDSIKKLKGISGRHKRVLEAWASFARKDGTNIHPSKEAVAERAGVSRWTVYRNTQDLVEMGLLIDTMQVHHYPGGHYTTIYKIDPAALQSATQDVAKQRSKTAKTQCSNTAKSHVAKGDAILPLEPTNVEPSATNRSGQASKQVSKQDASLASLVSLSREASSNEILDQEKMWSWLPDGAKTQCSWSCFPQVFAMGMDQQLDAQVWAVDEFWYDQTGHYLDTTLEYVLAKVLITMFGFDEVKQVLEDTLVNAPSKKIDWVDFRVFSKHFLINQRKSRTYRRTLAAKRNRTLETVPA